jgi:hypothetical protein
VHDRHRGEGSGDAADEGIDAAVAVVGGGVAGAGAAAALADRGATVRLYEASAGLGGRTASRVRDGCRYDYGANYVKAPDERFERVLERALGDDRVAIRGEIGVLEGDGTVRDGREEQPTRWTGRTGLDDLPAGLAASTGVAVTTGTRVESLSRRDDGWQLTTENGVRDRVDGVVLAVPAGEAARVIGGADWDSPLQATLAEAADAVPHRTVPSVALHYPVRIEWPYYAVVNLDRDHRLGWLAREECKPGHVPDGESLFIAQANPAWTVGRAPELDPETAVDAMAESVAAVVGDDRLHSPDWTDATLWTAAQPDQGVNPALFERTLRHELALAGDWVAGTGRTYAALQTGLDAGRRLGRSLGT